MAFYTVTREQNIFVLSEGDRVFLPKVSSLPNNFCVSLILSNALDVVTIQPFSSDSVGGSSEDYVIAPSSLAQLYVFCAQLSQNNWTVFQSGDILGNGSSPEFFSVSATSSGGLNVIDTAGDHSIKITTASNEAANRTITIPLLSSNRTLALSDLAQNFTGSNTFTVDQTFNAGIVQGSGTQKYASTNLSGAQITGMFVTPVQLIPAPASGRIILIDSLAIFYTHVTTAYTGGGSLTVRYAGTSTDLTNNIASSIFTNASDRAAKTTSNTNTFATSNGNGAAVNLSNLTGSFATGDGTAVVHVWYREVTL